jgi:hypothetical protein
MFALMMLLAVATPCTESSLAFLAHAAQLVKTEANPRVTSTETACISTPQITDGALYHKFVMQDSAALGTGCEEPRYIGAHEVAGVTRYGVMILCDKVARYYSLDPAAGQMAVFTIRIDEVGGE